MILWKQIVIVNKNSGLAWCHGEGVGRLGGAFWHVTRWGIGWIGRIGVCECVCVLCVCVCVWCVCVVCVVVCVVCVCV